MLSCSNNTPKYCCPRCSCLTCSLPCYKRHKTWSQCSGKRDAAAYMKRSQLATPAGIDHDYNFLTGIERAFDNADRDADTRGISLEAGPNRESNATRRLQKRIQDARVIVRRAPKGMSRQKENRTHCASKNGVECLSWTVEWLLPNGSRRLHNCTESSSIEDAYSSFSSERAASKSKKRKRATQPLGREKDDSQKSSGVHPQAQVPSGLEHETQISIDQALDFRTTRQAQEDLPSDHYPIESETTNPTASAHPPDKSIDQGISYRDSEDSHPDRGFDPVSEEPTKTTTPASQTPATSQLQPPKPNFYLHRPLSMTPTRVLIPLSPKTTLRDALTNRTILEFPTIHVLLRETDDDGEGWHSSPLPNGMQLERDYLRHAEKMVEELDAELKPFLAETEAPGDRDGDEQAKEGQASVPALDEGRVWDTLRRDVAAVGRDALEG